MRLDAWGNSVTGLVRSANEDAFAIRLELGVFVVADGLGAHPEGERASRLSVDTICAALADAGAQQQQGGLATWERNLSAAVAQAHATLRESSEAYLKRPPYLPMASTAVVLALPPNERCAYWIHSGDSRLYRWRAARLELLTADHTDYGDCYRNSDRIALDLRHTNHLKQALGTDGGAATRVTSAPLADDDVFLLCTDGVSGMLASQVIGGVLVESPSVQSAGAALIEAAMQAGGHDNATVIVVRVTAE